jgi:hypothetical protein
MLIAALAVLYNVSNAQVNPDSAQAAQIDRFSQMAGHLQVRDSMNGLPGPNKPVDFDMGPFITKGFGPEGQSVTYYNFDVQPLMPAPIYVLFRKGDTASVNGQLNIIDVIPGEPGYNDFWQVCKVTVPSNYKANTITSLQEIKTAGYKIDTTKILVNCPVVPKGSAARLRLNGESTELTRGWYKNKVVYYFNFFEKPLMVTDSGKVPVDDIYVSFNINPNQPGGGPPSGFKIDSSLNRTHNVTASVPSDSDYSPLWSVNIYDNAGFSSVKDLASAEKANILVKGAANVNCPIVQLSFATDVKSENNITPDKFSLDQNYPNPFNPSTRINFSIPRQQNVSLIIYNVLGKEVSRLINQNLNPGNYSVEWNGVNASSGIYFYRLITNTFTETKKMMLLK